MVVAGRLAALARLNDLLRPGIALAAAACLLLLADARWLLANIPVEIDVRAFPLILSIPSLHEHIIVLLLAGGLLLIVCCWWLPRSHLAALLVPVAVAGLAAPLVAADPLVKAIALALAASALAPLLARGKGDGGAPLLVGMVSLGAALLIVGVAIVRSAETAPASLPLARVLLLVAFALMLGVAPFPLWLAGVGERGHAAGAALAAAGLPTVVVLVAWEMARWPALGLLAGRELEMLTPVGMATAALASLAVLAQQDARRMAGLLLAADLGYLLAGLGASIGVGPQEPAFPLALVQLAGRSLAALVLFVSLSLPWQERAPRLLLLLCGGWMALGGPLTASFPARSQALQYVPAAGDLWGWALAGCLALSLAAYAFFVARADAAWSEQTERPAQRLLVALLTAAVVLSLLLWRNPGWLSIESLGAAAWIGAR